MAELPCESRGAANVSAFRRASIEIDSAVICPATEAAVETLMALIEVETERLARELRSDPGSPRQAFEISVEFAPVLIAALRDPANYSVALVPAYGEDGDDAAA
jgi:hypothetical protein